MFLGFLNKIQTKRIDINVLVVAVIVNVLGLRSKKYTSGCFIKQALTHMKSPV